MKDPFGQQFGYVYSLSCDTAATLLASSAGGSTEGVGAGNSSVVNVLDASGGLLAQVRALAKGCEVEFANRDASSTLMGGLDKYRVFRHESEAEFGVKACKEFPNLTTFVIKKVDKMAMLEQFASPGTRQTSADYLQYKLGLSADEYSFRAHFDFLALAPGRLLRVIGFGDPALIKAWQEPVQLWESAVAQIAETRSMPDMEAPLTPKHLRAIFDAKQLMERALSTRPKADVLSFPR